MKRSTKNFLLLIALAASIALNLAVRPDHGKPNAQFIMNMAFSVPYDSFSPNPIYKDGKTMQEPLPGTIRRGAMPEHYAATPEDALRAGEELTNEFSSNDARAAERGAAVYGVFCAPCHGPGGAGDGAVARKGFPPPPSLLTGNSLKMKDGQIYHIITHGTNNMPKYAAQAARDDRWKVILYVRSLQKAAADKARLGQGAETPPADAAVEPVPPAMDAASSGTAATSPVPLGGGPAPEGAGAAPSAGETSTKENRQ